jgi:hypothetical protein
MTQCKHPNATVASFGSGEVYHSPDCNTYVRPVILAPPAPTEPDAPAE